MPDLPLPPAAPPTDTPPVQPVEPVPPRPPLTYFWNTATSTDPTVSANWFPDFGTIPTVGDTIRMIGNTMTVHGSVLDGTFFMLGNTGVEVPMPDPVLNVTGGVNLLLIPEGAPDVGSHIQVNATGENTLDILLPGSSQELHPTATTMDVNVADNSIVIGRLQVVDTAFNMHGGSNTTFELESGKDSSLVRANRGPDGYVHIDPNIIGTGKIQMAFSDLELSGSVTPQVEIDLNQSSSLILDHADTFAGIIKFAEHAGSVVTLKDFQFGTNFTINAGLFSGTTSDGRTVNFQLQFSPNDIINGVNTAAGLEIFATAKG